MVTVGMNYQVIEGKQQQFEAMFTKVLSAMNGTTGHTESHLYVDVSSPSSYLIVSQWNSEEAFDAFVASEQFKNVVTWGKEQILSGRPRHEVFGRSNPAG